MRKPVLLTFVFLLFGLRAATPPLPPPEAQKFLHLFDQLRAAESARTSGIHQPVAFRLTADEINAYLRYSLRAVPRPGLDSMNVKIFDHNYVSTFTVLDFDAVERWKPGTIPAILRPVLNGKKSVWIDFRFQAADTKVSFAVEKAYYNNIRLPAFLVEKMIGIVAARQPEHLDTSKPVPLPFGLRDLRTANRTMIGAN
jgi:hypothetical protein